MPDSPPTGGRDVEQVRGCCPLDCQDSCSWVAHVEDGRVVRVSGAKDHPFTRGALCAKVNDYQTRTYAPDRLLTPLIRTGAKGAGGFREATWDEALGTVAERFTDIVATAGAEALLPHSFVGSMGVVQRRSLLRLFHVLGASRTTGSVCGQAWNALGADGFPLGFDPEEMADARFVLVWGANPLSTSHHTWHFTAEARKRHGARIVCIDPVRTRTAATADEHIAIRPGTDWALAAGMARVLFEEDLADLAYAEQVVADLDAYRAEVAGWTPDRVAEVCGIDAEVVAALAREFAAAEPAVLRAGIGVQQSEVGDAVVRALSALPILAGHWQHRGGGLYAESFPEFREAAAGRPDLIPGTPRKLDLARLGEVLTDEDLDPPVLGLMVWLANPATVQVDAARVRQGLAREELFTVVVEHVMTDTARYADVVLPSTTQLEHLDVQGSWGHHYVSANLPAVPPVGGTRSHGDIARALATRMGLDHPALHESDREIAAAALPAGLDLDHLLDAGWIKRSPARFHLPPDGRRLRLAAGDLPRIQAAPETDRLQLLTPKPHHFLNSTFADAPRHRRAMQQPTVFVHPDDAAARGLEDDTDVEVAAGTNAVRARLAVSDTVVRGVAALPGKWWSADTGGGGINALVPARWSPRGQPAYNDTEVTITAAPRARG
ncbi:molybdopterin-dependent oxidoreductase [Nitriliruptor alkaliphilus]|uniref:molybdopterin-dependent oxidoreductase n=1 Tax=Nitriliruptor alkaliphilus TaxID=427918 RepID=UPI0009FAFD62